MTGAQNRLETTHSECECFADIDALLKLRNTVLVRNLFGPPRALVETMVDEKKRGANPTKVFATFCPFCGAKYPRGI
jgi:hypothetical protein